MQRLFFRKPLLLCTTILLLCGLIVTLLYIILPGLLSPPRGPYLQSVTPDSVWVVWDTRDATRGWVEFGTTRALGQMTQEAQEARHHEVQLSGLQPYTNYYYRVDGGRIASFRSAAAPDQTTYRFAVYGDSREGALTHRMIVARMLKARPDFVIHTGDLVELGNCQSCWDEFFMIAAPLLRSAPLYPTLGNHEDDQSPFADTDYFDIFHLPGVERWYAFDYGNARFISLKADGYPTGVYFPVQEQMDWLEQELENNDKPWLFVYFHLSVFTSTGEEFLETGLRQRLVPLFEHYGVNAVFMGHKHSYERVVRNGVTYITTAGGGATLYDLKQPETGSQTAAHAYHFVLVDVSGEQLHAQAIDRSGKVIDTFELNAGQR
jgi:hypothetical protein